MQAIGRQARRTLTPLLKGIVWSATLCVGIEVPAAAQRVTDQTAMSVLRPAPAGGTPGLMQPLAPSDAARLRRTFELQARGDLAGGERESDRLADRRLLGHVLADRWLRPQGQVTPAGLEAWLADYADHPDAAAMHRRLAALAPAGAALPAPPAEAAEGWPDVAVPEERDAAMPPVTRNPALDRVLRDRAREGNVAAVQALIARTRGMSPAYASLLRADAAMILFQAGRDRDAQALAAQALAAMPGNARAAFALGLAGWGRGEWAAALVGFERAARIEGAAPALRAAAAFWTARAAVRAGHPALYIPWLTQAAQHTRTFYGLVARRALGLPPDFAWTRELLGEAETQALAETAGGWRALALLQIGQRDRAEAELRLLWGRAREHPVLLRAMLVVAQEAKLQGLAAELATASQTADGRPRDLARFPVPPLLPTGGYRIDPALLYALALQESRFDAGAVSPAGARGLMQIMPATASYVANDPSLNGGARQHLLHDPAYSLELGQRYVHYLARHETVEGDLIRLLAAYNTGPGNLGRWLPAARHRDDPFLFIEAIPTDETRDFVRRVLTYSWIYASRLGLPAPSLDTIAAGGFPRFAGPEAVTAMLRARRAALH